MAALDSLLTARYVGDSGALRLLEATRARAVGAYRAAGGSDDADRLGASLLAGDAIAGLAAEGLLEPADVRDVTLALTELSDGRTGESTTLELFLQAVSTPLLSSLPPLYAVESVLRLLVLFGVVSEASLWTRPGPGKLTCAVHLGDEEPSRRMRLAARLCFAGSEIATARSQIRSAPVLRWGRPEGVLVARSTPAFRESAASYLAEAAVALSPLLERALLLERSVDRERTLVTGSERRLTRLGFDLHDGPIQDVLALAGDLRRLGNDVYPFVGGGDSESVSRRFEDLSTRLAELDQELREIAHSLESRSAVSRPIEEVLHREVEAFTQRTQILTRLTIEGASAFLTSAQRVALFRVVQEGLSNIREHSGAASVDVRLRCGRSRVELVIEDDGNGFGVEAGLASAAKRGRLGLLGISERVRMLGGTFELESAPGGPTVLAVTLPRWEPLDPAAAG